MLISALNSVIGVDNPLALASKRSVCVILIDGLGAHNLKGAGAHASFMNSMPSEPAMCWFPATTATSITSFATSSSPWSNGFLGYQVLDRSNSKQMNLLSGWSDFASGQEYQKLPTVAEQALSSNVLFHTIAPAAYERSGFTGATMRGGSFHGVNGIEDRFNRAKQLLSDTTSKVIYLYIPELDQIAHSQGCGSTAWLNQLEQVDSLVRVLSGNLAKTAGLVVTADHGVVDVPKESHIYLDEIVSGDHFEFVGGDTRALYLYLKDPSNVSKIRTLLEEKLGDTCYITTTEELTSAGYWQSLDPISMNVSPDLMVLAKKKVALYHRDFAKSKSMQMVGHHGSISSEELAIPLIKIGF